MNPTHRHEQHEHDPIRVVDDLRLDEAGRPAAWLEHLECYSCAQPLPDQPAMTVEVAR